MELKRAKEVTGITIWDFGSEHARLLGYREAKVQSSIVRKSNPTVRFLNLSEPLSPAIPNHSARSSLAHVLLSPSAKGGAMSETIELILSDSIIDQRILLIRGQRVMLDADLADLYGIPTKALNQAVKRNQDRFPSDFMFQLSKEERDELVTICDHLKKIKYSRVLPYAFTEHGALMLASVLNSPRAVELSLFVVRAFIRLRELLASHKDLARKLDELEKHVRDHDGHIQTLFEAIRQLMTPGPGKNRKIGFQP